MFFVPSVQKPLVSPPPHSSVSPSGVSETVQGLPVFQTKLGLADLRTSGWGSKRTGEIWGAEELCRLNLLPLEDAQIVTLHHSHDLPEASASLQGLASQGVTLARRLHSQATWIPQGLLVLQLVLCSMSKRGGD